jgi:hypothetical protein
MSLAALTSQSTWAVASRSSSEPERARQLGLHKLHSAGAGSSRHARAQALHGACRPRAEGEWPLACSATRTRSAPCHPFRGKRRPGKLVPDLPTAVDVDARWADRESVTRKAIPFRRTAAFGPPTASARATCVVIGCARIRRRLDASSDNHRHPGDTTARIAQSGRTFSPASNPRFR